MSVQDKLRINKDKPLWLVDPPKDVLDIFEGLKLRKTLPAKQEIEQLVFFPLDKKQLYNKFDAIIGKLTDDAVFWIAWPKKTGSISSDLTRMDAWDRVFQSDWQGASSIFINDDWTGLRLKKRDPNAKYKRDIPMEERKTEGVDYLKRTVKLPADVSKLLKSYKGLEEFFYTMSFSHKREYMEAIAEAKKPETRLRRIEKMIEQVSKLKTEKEKKKKS